MGLYDSKNGDVNSSKIFSIRNFFYLLIIVLFFSFGVYLVKLNFYLNEYESEKLAHEKVDMLESKKIKVTTFMNGKYKLGYQISPTTTDPDELLMKNDIANQLTPTNERQFWAKQNWNDNVVTKSRNDVYLLPWEGNLVDALKITDANMIKLKSKNLVDLGPPVYWIATSKIFYNMSGNFRVGILFRKSYPDYENEISTVNSKFPSLIKVSEVEPIVEIDSYFAKNLLEIRGLPNTFEYAKTRY